MIHQFEYGFICQTYIVMNIQKGKCINHALYEEANNAHERALVFMHKMPRIWIDYGEFLMRQESFV